MKKKKHYVVWQHNARTTSINTNESDEEVILHLLTDV